MPVKIDGSILGVSAQGAYGLRCISVSITPCVSTLYTMTWKLRRGSSALSTIMIICDDWQGTCCPVAVTDWQSPFVPGNSIRKAS